MITIVVGNRTNRRHLVLADGRQDAGRAAGAEAVRPGRAPQGRDVGQALAPAARVPLHGDARLQHQYDMRRIASPAKCVHRLRHRSVWINCASHSAGRVQ